jgi:phosphatidyl-myo-inositol dimannoside synthase
LGRLAKPDALYKGYDRLLKVVAELVKEYKKVRLVYAGRGNYREDLEFMAKEMNVSEYVSFTGSVEEEDLVAVYQSCHVFSLITIAGEGKGEGIPLTPLEAMACGKPVLVGNQDGSREAVFENSNGFVLDPTDLESHMKVFRTYLEDPRLLKEHSSNAFEIGHKVFSYDRFCLETQDVMNIKLRKGGK